MDFREVGERLRAKARGEMRPKGYLQAGDLAEKLALETGKRVTVGMLKGYRMRGRIECIFHEGANLWFYPVDTKIYKAKSSCQPVKPKDSGSEQVVLGPWSKWPAPNATGGSKSLGWFGGIV